MSEVKLGFDVRGIATLTINRPEVKNALNFRSQQAFSEAVSSMAAMPFLRAVLITGAGDAFISGADIQELQYHPTRKDGEKLATVMGDALDRLEQLPLISIAVINGPARGGGMEIALACDMRIMAETADLAFVQARLGLSPGWGGGKRLVRMVGYAKAIELLSTSRMIKAEEAIKIGLVNAAYPAEGIMQAADELAERISDKPKMTVGMIKQVLRQAEDDDDESRFKRKFSERDAFIHLWDQEERREIFRQFMNRKSKRKLQEK